MVERPHSTEEKKLKHARRKRQAQLELWGHVITTPCRTCHMPGRKRCRDLRKDHEGRLLSYPHPSRVRDAWAANARFILDNAALWSPEFDDLKDEI